MARPVLFTTIRVGNAGFTDTFRSYPIESTSLGMSNEKEVVQFNNDQEFAFKTLSGIDIKVLSPAILSDADVNKAMGTYSKIVLVGDSGAFSLTLDNVQLDVIDKYDESYRYAQLTAKRGIARLGANGTGAFTTAEV